LQKNEEELVKRGQKQTNKRGGGRGRAKKNWNAGQVGRKGLLIRSDTYINGNQTFTAKSPHR